MFKPNFSHAWSIIGSDMPSALGLVQTVVGGIKMLIVSFTLFELEYWRYINSQGRRRQYLERQIGERVDENTRGLKTENIKLFASLFVDTLEAQ